MLNHPPSRQKTPNSAIRVFTIAITTATLVARSNALRHATIAPECLHMKKFLFVRCFHAVDAKAFGQPRSVAVHYSQGCRSAYCPRRNYYWINSGKGGSSKFEGFLLEKILADNFQYQGHCKKNKAWKLLETKINSRQGLSRNKLNIISIFEKIIPAFSAWVWHWILLKPLCWTERRALVTLFCLSLTICSKLQNNAFFFLF